MRRVAAQLMARDRLGRDVFARGEVEAVTEVRKIAYEASLLDLMQAYARIKTREDFQPLHLSRGPVYTLEQALERMRGLIGSAVDWQTLSAFLPEGWQTPSKRRSAVAATFAAALELAKAGRVDLAQDATFAPIRLRLRREADTP